jgi:GntR family transcriptional regulator, rspAB operon transcriptional repressor
MTSMPFALSNTQIDRRRPLREQIYAIVRTLILTGSIKPGELIDEKAIAAQLSVSRTPVREAVKKLSDEHLVEVVAQSATRAARIDRHEIEESYLIRRALEVESASQAASRITQEHTDRLSDILHAHGRALERRQFVEAIKADDEFHAHIAMISNLPRLWKTIEISKAQIDRCRHGRGRPKRRSASTARSSAPSTAATRTRPLSPCGRISIPLIAARWLFLMPRPWQMPMRERNAVHIWGKNR